MDADIIIIGAGPAGASAAVTAARAGAKVLLLERERLPREKLCSGVLSPKSTTQLASLLDLSDIRTGTSPFVIGSTDAMLFVSGQYRSLCKHAEAPLFFASRPAMDMALVEQAAHLGAEVRDGQKVAAVDAEMGAVTLVTGEALRGRVLIGADGARGVSSRVLNGTLPRRGIGLEVRVPDTRPTRLRHSVADFTLRTGYFWQFPKWDGTVAVGVGSVDKSAFPHMREMLARYATVEGLALPDHVPGHPVPCFPQPILQDGLLLLAGDAAGLVDPLIGEGIPYALLSGRIAADTALRYLADGSPTLLAAYPAIIRRRVLAQHRPLRRLAAMGPLTQRAMIYGLVRVPWTQGAMWRYLSDWSVPVA